MPFFGSQASSKIFPKDDRGNYMASRDCTDIACASFFLFCMILSGGVVGYSVVSGDSRRLSHGFDYSGKLCGIDLPGKPFLYYCGSHELQSGLPKRLDYHSRTCLDSCPKDSSSEVACLMKSFHNFTDLGKDTQQGITFDTTLNVDIAQSVTLQKSYPTEPYHGAFCIPRRKEGSTLREDTLNQMRGSVRVASVVSSFRHAWPLPIAAALVAGILSMVFLQALRRYAGLLLFVSLCVGTLLLLVLGVFFLFGIFFDSWNLQGHYQQLNPLFQTYPGSDGKAASVVIGLFLLVGGIGMGFATMHSFDEIDESIGLIQAACECIFSHGEGGWDLLLQPLWQSLSLLALIVGLCWGAMLVASVGYINTANISINDRQIEGLEKDFKHYPGWTFVLWFYGACAVWLVLVILASQQFALAYAVCEWFFHDIDEKETEKDRRAAEAQDPISKALKKQKGQYVVKDVKLQGVTQTGGFLQLANGQDAMLVPIGPKRPGGKDLLTPAYVAQRKDVDFGLVERGWIDGMFHHVGSFALGSLVNAATAPFRAVSQLVRAIASAGGNGGGTLRSSAMDTVDQSPVGLVMSSFALLANLLDHLFGGFGRGAYIDIVLKSTSYFTASQEAVEFILEVGGVVAVLHGSTGLFELVGIVVITAICGTLSFVVIDLPYFKDPGSGAYVSDPTEITMLCTLVSGIVAFSFMSLFNVTADTLLYVFAWSRRYKDSIEKPIEKYCPAPLMHLVKEELSQAPATVLKPSSSNGFTKHAAAFSSIRNAFASRAAGATGTEGNPLLPLPGGP